MSKEDSLVTLVKLSHEITQKLIETLGETTEAIDAELMILQEKLPSKYDAYYFVIEQLKNEASLWGERASKFDQIADRLMNQAKHMKDQLTQACLALGLEELAGNDFTWKLQRAKDKVIIDNPELVPALFKEIVQTINIKKDEILKSDEPVPGTHLEKSKYLKPYPNTRKK